jgi:hypothetical protein
MNLLLEKIPNYLQIVKKNENGKNINPLDYACERLDKIVTEKEEKPSEGLVQLIKLMIAMENQLLVDDERQGLITKCALQIPRTAGMMPWNADRTLRLKLVF